MVQFINDAVSSPRKHVNSEAATLVTVIQIKECEAEISVIGFVKPPVCEQPQLAAYSLLKF